MSNEKKSNIFSVCFERLFNGIIKENPTFVMMLGMCPTLAVTTSCINGIGMGLTTTVVLALSNVFISMLRKIIPDKARVPAFIVVVVFADRSRYSSLSLPKRETLLAWS